MIRSTHTYVTLEVSQPTYDEIRFKLLAAEYYHCFELRDNGTGPIDMNGLAILPEFQKPEN